MSGKRTAPKSGDELKQRVVALAQSLGLKTSTKAVGATRYIDVVISDEKSGKRLGVECKFQATSGTAEEKIPATIQDMEHWPIPGIEVIDGEGFSKNMQG